MDLKAIADEAGQAIIAAGLVKKGTIAFEDDDLPYEEDILKNPASLRTWWRYIEHKKKSKANWKQVSQVYERALVVFERSYKLWYNYLRYRKRLIAHKPPTDEVYAQLAHVYERALVHLNKMPRIWMEYCELMTKRRVITEARRVFDRALRALPVTQHPRIWPLYIEFVTGHDIPETALRVYRRYLKMNPGAREDFVEYLRKIDRLDEAAVQLSSLVNEDKPMSAHGKTTHQLWSELCEMISKNPTKIHSVNVDAIMRQGIKRFSDQVGVLWCALAEYYIRAAHFEKARDVFEEAMGSVKTVFDAYAAFEERATAAMMDEVEKKGDDEEAELELNLRFARFEHLMERRQLLLNSVLLRQNPHNVHEWLNRVKLYEGQPEKQIATFMEAVQTVQPRLQVGRLSSLWVAFAKFYEEGGQLEDARSVFERALQAPYSKVDELATIWCEYTELELRHKSSERAIRLMKRATAVPPRATNYHDESASVQQRVHRSLRVWSLYADLEECFGTVESTRAVYDRILDLRIATPQVVINYAMFLEQHEYWELSFKAYERGIALFKWPNVFDIWNRYLVTFVKRYGGKKLERARDLFEQCLEGCPAKYCKNIFLLYAKLEEEHGLAGHAMTIYKRSVSAVEKDEMYSMYNIYLKKATEMYGTSHTRHIYEEAISNLPEKEMSMRFAKLETVMGEIDRARAIYQHCAEICDPRAHGQFWEVWKEFEVKHGNEDTVRDMLRIKRSVQAAYNVNYMSAQLLAATSAAEKARDAMASLDAAAHAEKQKQGVTFVKGTSKTQIDNKTHNPDEIDIGDDVDEDVETKTVPAAIFGGLAKE